MVSNGDAAKLRAAGRNGIGRTRTAAARAQRLRFTVTVLQSLNTEGQGFVLKISCRQMQVVAMMAALDSSGRCGGGGGGGSQR